MGENRGPILLTGGTGQVGGALVPLLRNFGAVVAPGRAELDLGDAKAVRAFVREVRPRWIVNPAAYTAVDKAEEEPAAAYALNCDTVEVLGQEAARIGAPVLHFSTDYVFSGEGTEPWREDDSTGPLGVYGASKLAGERALAATGAPYLIFRTSWVYGAQGRNFLLTMLRLGREREELRIVDDQHGAPTWAHDLALLAAHTMKRCEELAVAGATELQAVVSEISGVMHACAAGETTWFGFASEFLRRAQLADPGQPYAKLVPITTAEYPTLARRPRNSRLDCTRLQEVLHYSMPHWRTSVDAVMHEVLGKERVAPLS